MDARKEAPLVGEKEIYQHILVYYNRAGKMPKCVFVSLDLYIFLIEERLGIYRADCCEILYIDSIPIYWSDNLTNEFFLGIDV